MAALPPYRLQTLLEIRERKKEAAELYLGQCFRALKDAEDKMAAMQLELQRMVAKRETRRREYLEKAMKGEMSATDVINTNTYIERLIELELVQQEAIEGQKVVVRQRQDDVESARQALIVANQELKALEKHKEKWLEAVKKERAAKEEDTMDELAQTIFTRGGGA